MKKALFRSEIFLDSDTVALSFLFDKHCLIIEQLDLKDSSHDLQTNYIISFCFHLYLMLHACAARFDVTGNLEKFLVFEGRRHYDIIDEPIVHHWSQTN